MNKIYFSDNYKSPLGDISMASSGDCLIGLWLEGQKYYGSKFLNSQIKDSNQEIFKRTIKWLDSYFNFEKPKITEIKIELIGTEFQKEVWNILLQIPYGETITYGEIAKKIAHNRGIKSMSAQAVGGAVGRNPISIILPCHRVIGTNNALTGYAGGIDKKTWLLEHESKR